MPLGIKWRLGYLSGEIRGYDDENELIKIAKEIQSKFRSNTANNDKS